MLHCENDIKINHLHYYSCNCYLQSNGEAVLNVGNYISNQSRAVVNSASLDFKENILAFVRLSQIWGRSLTCSCRGWQKGLETIISLNYIFLWYFPWALGVFSLHRGGRGESWVWGMERNLFLIWETWGVKGKVWIPCYWTRGLWLSFCEEVFLWLNWNSFPEERPHWAKSLLCWWHWGRTSHTLPMCSGPRGALLYCWKYSQGWNNSWGCPGQI